MKNLQTIKNPASHKNAIYIISQNGHKIIDLDEIMYCKADSNYSEINLKNKKKIQISRSLCHLTNALSRFKFLRCNKSFLINLSVKGSFNRHYRIVFFQHLEIKIPKARSKLVFPMLTAFEFKERIRKI